MNGNWFAFAQKLEEFQLYVGALQAMDEVEPVTPEVDAHRTRLQHRAARPLLPAGLYFLVTVDNQGFALPLSANITVGPPPPWLRDSSRAAIAQATAATARFFEARGELRKLPSMACQFHIDTGEFGAIDGGSLGAAAALAFIQRATNQPWPCPVLVTGEVSANGNIHSVGGLGPKVTAALKELGELPGKILIPFGISDVSDWPQDPRVIRVANLSELVSAVWGAADLAIAREQYDFGNTLRRIRISFDHQSSIAQLLAMDTSKLSLADLALYYHELMIQYRHAGQTEDATRTNEIIRQLVAKVGHLLDSRTIQEMEIQRLGNEINLFPGDWFRSDLEQVLDGSLDPPNRVRCLWILARFESVNENHERAVELRTAALELQRARSDLARRIPITLCHLVWETARAGHRIPFIALAEELAAATDPQDLRQWKYNQHAVLASTLRFGEHRAVWQYLQGGPAPYPAYHSCLREFFESSTPVEKHPEISNLRLLIRTCRRNGEHAHARRLGLRFSTTVENMENLTHWLFYICSIERDLATLDTTSSPEAVQNIRDTAARLLDCHKNASLFYYELCDACESFDGSEESILRLERQLDRLYY